MRIKDLPSSDLFITDFADYDRHATVEREIYNALGALLSTIHAARFKFTGDQVVEPFVDFNSVLSFVRVAYLFSN